MTRLWLLGGSLFALTMLALSLHVPGALGIGSVRLKTWFVVIAGVSAAVYLLAVLTVTKGPSSRQGVWVVLLIAAALRLPLIVSPPFLSTDVYRYVWDGRVQAAGINPYRYVPADPALASFRDDLVYPRISRAEYARTIYQPAAQIVFAAVGLIWSSVTAVKMAMVGFEALAIVCLLHLLAAAKLPLQRVLIYAWNPLLVWAFAGNGHVDAVTIGLLAAALLLRVRRQDGWAGIALGLAIATKFLPAVVAPALWRRGAGWLTVLGIIVSLSLAYIIYNSTGAPIFGFLGGYRAEEGYDSGAGFWLIAGLSRVMELPDWAAFAYKTVAVVILATFAAWFAWINPPNEPVAICSAAGNLMALLMFAISPHYPWYFASLTVPCVLAPLPAVIWMATAPILLYLDTFGDRFIWPSVVYVPALALAFANLRPSASAEPIKGIP
jgi:alpha-1,6-mannosyltransferase